MFNCYLLKPFSLYVATQYCMFQISYTHFRVSAAIDKLSTHNMVQYDYCLNKITQILTIFQTSHHRQCYSSVYVASQHVTFNIAAPSS